MNWVNTEYRAAIMKTLLGVVVFVGGCWFWYYLVGNPLQELALIQRAQIAPGFIVETWEVVGDDDMGRAHWLHGAKYTYRLPDGREFTQTTKESPGRLKKEFLNLKKPYSIEVQYLPENPTVSRIKGEGSDNILDWAWRKAGLGTLILVILLSPGFVLLRDGVRNVFRVKRATNTSIK
jgi:hypothetical protein